MAKYWFYEMIDLGYNYRMIDFQCALGISQLQKLPEFLERRREIAALYDEALADISGIEPLGPRADVLPAKHYAKRNTPSSMPHAPSSMPSTHAYIISMWSGLILALWGLIEQRFSPTCARMASELMFTTSRFTCILFTEIASGQVSASVLQQNQPTKVLFPCRCFRG